MTDEEVKKLEAEYTKLLEEKDEEIKGLNDLIAELENDIVTIKNMVDDQGSSIRNSLRDMLHDVETYG